ncbi:MAG: hypothetical protein RLZZ568_171 [Cyanobacteriota bacterium]
MPRLKIKGFLIFFLLGRPVRPDPATTDVSIRHWSSLSVGLGRENRTLLVLALDCQEC